MGQGPKSLGEALIQMALAREEQRRSTECARPFGSPWISSADVAEVFFKEQHRYCYRRPKHCPKGMEQCRTTGICPFALRPLGVLPVGASEE